MNLADFVATSAAASDGSRLLQQAAALAEQLPTRAPEADESWITLAFGQHRDALAASIVACWLKGHGAAIVENALRDRIKPVLDDARTVALLHDTGAGRTLQVPRWLAQAELPAAPTDLPAMPEPCALAVHVQDDDGSQTWRTWSAAALRDELDGLDAAAEQLEADDHRRYTPGFLPALFWNCLRPLRHGAAFQEQTPHAVRAQLRGVPPMRAANLPGDSAAGAARDPNGQVLYAEHHLAQGLGRRGQPVERTLAFTNDVHDPDTATVRALIPANYLFFEGHFDGYPVIAGGVQLHQMALPALRSLCGELPSITGLDGVKFVSRMAPGETIDIELQRSEDAHKVSFEFKVGERRCTVGRLSFAAAVSAFASSTA